MVLVGLTLIFVTDEYNSPSTLTGIVTVAYTTPEGNSDYQAVWEQYQQQLEQSSTETAETDGTEDEAGTGEDPMQQLYNIAGSFSDVDLQGISNYAAAQAKLEKDEAYREQMKNARVVSSNTKLYLDGYSYGASQNVENPYNYVPLNNQKVPMSQYTVPDSVKIGEDGVPEYYSYYIDGIATAYCDVGTTATGTHTYQGTVAVDPREIPYGTEMWITSLDGSYVYGYCRAEDTGGFIYYSNGATVDLFMYSSDECWDWGRTNVRIYILSK